MVRIGKKPAEEPEVITDYNMYLETIYFILYHSRKLAIQWLMADRRYGY
jgi:hypothetical protein